MAESYLITQLDTRTFGAQIQRLQDDLARPDLAGLITSYLQDAMRWAQRQAFFFNDTDNSAVPVWAANTFYPQGSTIVTIIAGTAYAVVACNAGLSGGTTPGFSSTIFTSPSSSGSYPPPAGGTPGTVIDNQIIWATVATYQQFYWTQLSTVYSINQYVPPLDYVAPTRIEVTVPSYRIRLLKISYDQLRDYDTVRPAPITAYPTMWAWFQQQIYLWPYPNGFYPLTLSYRTAPQVVTQQNQSNMWTTTAERYIRKLAQSAIEAEVLHDDAAAALSWKAAELEMRALRSQTISMNGPGGIPPSSW